MHFVKICVFTYFIKIHCTSSLPNNYPSKLQKEGRIVYEISVIPFSTTFHCCQLVNSTAVFTKLIEKIQPVENLQTKHVSYFSKNIIPMKIVDCNRLPSCGRHFANKKAACTNLNLNWSSQSTPMM